MLLTLSSRFSGMRASCANAFFFSDAIDASSASRMTSAVGCALSANAVERVVQALLGSRQ